MSLDVRTEDGIVILTPRGMLLGGKETEELDEKVKELDSQGNEKLLINLGKSTFMSTPGISVIFRAFAKYVKRGARVKLCCIDRKIREVFVLVTLTLRFGDDIHDTEDDALASFRQPAELVGR
jgi:anti-anti-sigma factor